MAMQKGPGKRRATLWIGCGLGALHLFAAARVSAQPLAPVAAPSPVAVASPAIPVKEPAAVYIVQLSAPAAGRY